MTHETQTHRISYWDNIKGLMIVLVVFAHFLLSLPLRSSLLSNIITYIYMFHMPVFVFVSGFFGKSEHSHSWQSLGKLLFLYFIFNSFAGFLYGFDSLLIPQYSYWYLLSLIVWRALTPALAAFPGILSLSLGFALIIGFFPSIDNTFALARIIGFYPYYVAGYLLDTTKANNFAAQIYTRRALRGIVLLAGAVILAFGCEQFFHYTAAALRMSAYADASTGALGRAGLYAVAFSSIFALRCLVPSRPIPLLTLFGRNSLWIFLFHRPFVLALAPCWGGQADALTATVALLITILFCLIFGNDKVSAWMNRLAADGANLFQPTHKSRFNIAKLLALCVCAGFLYTVLQHVYPDLTWGNKPKTVFYQENKPVEESSAFLPQVLSAEKQKAFQDGFRITFAGDLILLEDQVKRGYRGENKYDFADVFEYAAPYISSADFAVGVFEGPMAGAQAGYSNGNFDDGKELRLNFPDEFARAVQNAGFDLVTTANNHVLDKKADGAHRTLDVLDDIGLEHIGSYRNADEKEKKHIKLIEKDGIKMAVLAYTYGSNYMDTDTLFEGELDYVTSVISGTEGELFEKMKARVEQDFQQAKQLQPDLIIVLPHVGTQFENQPDAVQETWFKIFKENGADIILGDHPHVVEPVVLDKQNGKTTATIYCPGNFANSYRKQQGDTSMLVDVYVNRSTKEIIGASIVPLYTQARADGNYRALPIFEMLYNDTLREQLSTDDLARAKAAHDIITQVVFGHSWDISGITPRYYMDEQGAFLRQKQQGLQLTQEMKESPFLQALQSAESICFVGDSVTQGTKNEGAAWYEPLEPYLPARDIFNFSRGGATVADIVNNADQIPAAQAYVIAIGTNDVRYRNPARCAMTAQDFIQKIDLLKQKLTEKSPHAVFIFIAPWYSTDEDPFSKLGFAAKTEENERYSRALAQYCREQGVMCVNSNGYIRQALEKYPQQNYLLDHIHPNAAQGVLLYAQAVLLSAEKI